MTAGRQYRLPFPLARVIAYADAVDIRHDAGD